MTKRLTEFVPKLRKICLALPDTDERISWGHPNWRVANKIFAAIGTGHGYDGPHIAFKAPNREVLKNPQVVGAGAWVKHGWVMRLIGDDENARNLDWKEIEGWLRESHALVAPKPKRAAAPKASKKKVSRSR